MKNEFHLPERLDSPQAVREAADDLHLYAQWLEHQAVVQKTGSAATGTAPLVSAGTADLLSGGQPLAAPQLEALAVQLEEILKTAPRVSFTLAAPAPPPLKRQFVAWARQEINPQALVSFSFNSNLLGGMVLRLGSHIYDWSFRRQILEKRQNFAEVLRRV